MSGEYSRQWKKFVMAKAPALLCSYDLTELLWTICRFLHPEYVHFKALVKFQMQVEFQRVLLVDDWVSFRLEVFVAFDSRPRDKLLWLREVEIRDFLRVEGTLWW